MKKILEWLTQWVPKQDTCPDDSRAALERAHAAKRAAEERWPEVNEARTTTGDLKRQNHFIDGLRSTF